jgi:hypothetical protein
LMLLSLWGPVATLVGAGLLVGYYMFQWTPDAPGDERGM